MQTIISKVTFMTRYTWAAFGILCPYKGLRRLKKYDVIWGWPLGLNKKAKRQCFVEVKRKQNVIPRARSLAFTMGRHWYKQVMIPSGTCLCRPTPGLCRVQLSASSSVLQRAPQLTGHPLHSPTHHTARDEEAGPGHGTQRSKPHPHTPEAAVLYLQT